MRLVRLTALLLVPLSVLAQDAKRTILSSRDSIDGPFLGEHDVSDLRVSGDGTVVFTEESTKAIGDKPERQSYEATLSSDQFRHLRDLLESRDIRSLPKKVSSKTRPIDFFWQKSLEISRPNENQIVLIENFYPFLNLQKPVYPKALIELECSLQDIEAAAAKRPPVKDDDDWCHALLNHGKTATQAACHKDEAQPKIVAGQGWGPVRIGAALTEVDSFLGDGRQESAHSDVYFKDYETKGVQVSFERASNTVRAIFFYNRERGSESMGIFCGQADSGVNWQSSLEDVRMTYGRPTAEFSGTDSGGTWQRLVFAGIDFRFENGKLVRIGIPGA